MAERRKEADSHSPESGGARPALSRLLLRPLSAFLSGAGASQPPPGHGVAGRGADSLRRRPPGVSWEPARTGRGFLGAQRSGPRAPAGASLLPAAPRRRPPTHPGTLGRERTCFPGYSGNWTQTRTTGPGKQGSLGAGSGDSSCGVPSGGSEKGSNSWGAGGARGLTCPGHSSSGWSTHRFAGDPPRREAPPAAPPAARAAAPSPDA